MTQTVQRKIGWIARSYTRIALPGEFNIAIRKSKIEGIFLEKLTKFHEQLYGIYLIVDPGSDDEWLGRLGDMPPPYLLEIILVTYVNADPELLKEKLIEDLFVNKVDDPDDKADIPHPTQGKNTLNYVQLITYF